MKFGENIAERFSTGGATLEFEQVLDPLFSHGKKKRFKRKSHMEGRHLKVGID